MGLSYCPPTAEGVGVEITFFGVRGSTPCAGEATKRYGGNTACVVLRAEDADPILLDLGTGLRYFGESHPADRPLRAHALVTHLHWDHVQGLPFCRPLLCAGSSLTVHGPAHDGVGFDEGFDALMRPPFFPVTRTQLPGDVTLRTITPGVHDIAGAKVTALAVPHTDTTYGYRIERDGRSVAYVSDHQQPADGGSVDRAVLDLCDGVDVLIHDAQFTPEEFAAKSTWGHCTIEYAVHVAAVAGVGRLVLFHHDPSHDDDTLDALVQAARDLPSAVGFEILAAHEGLTLSLA